MIRHRQTVSLPDARVGRTLFVVALAALLPAGPLVAESDQGRSLVELGWSDDLRVDHGWLAEPWEVASPDDRAAASFGADGAVFSVATPDREMVWTRTTNPVWVADFPFLEIRYEVVGTPAGSLKTVLHLNDDCNGPITPGALNPENPAAQGGTADLGPATAGRHHVVIDLRTVFQSDRVARLSWRLQAGGEPVSLKVDRIAFWATDPREPSAPVAAADAPPLLQAHLLASPAVAAEWKPIALPSGPVFSADRLAWACSARANWPDDGMFESAMVPFRLRPAEEAALATGLMELEDIELRGEWQGSELALLLAARQVGSDQASFGRATGPRRGLITSPHRLLVELEYADGTTRQFFPWSPVRHNWSVAALAEPVIVPLDRERQLQRIVVRDRMTFGQVFLLAASINTAQGRVFASLAHEPLHQPARSLDRPQPVPVKWSHEDGRLMVESAWLRLVARTASGLDVESLTLLPAAREIIAAGEGQALLQVQEPNGAALPLRFENVRAEPDTAELTLRLAWSVAGTADRRVELELTVPREGRLHLRPALVNQSSGAWAAALTCPNLAACRISPEPDDRYYLLGSRSTSMGWAPLEVDLPYSGLFPLQFVDIYAPRAGGGLALWVEDRDQTPKRFRFRQNPQQTDLSVHYPTVSVAPGEQSTLPPTVLMPHAGDWHEGYQRYRGWIRQVIGPRPARLNSMFFCRRDYPVGGTGFLFDLRRGHYTPRGLIDESQRHLGGIDMIDISSWAYNEANGRVGEYRTNDLGGLDELRRGAQAAHKDGVKFGLYFEGYLIDRRSTLGEAGFPEWQMLNAQGNPHWWGNEQIELYACPGIPAWREAFSETIADVAAATGVDAVYVDQFGATGPDKACWSAAHGHDVPSNPLVEERAMLATIRQALDRQAPHTAVYIEYTPVDTLTGLIDAAFDYGMTHDVRQPHPTKLPLHRYLFPEVSFVQMVGFGIRPIPIGPEDLHRCIFHGVALWLKGRAAAWYSQDFLDLAAKAHPILREHADLFASGTCEPLIPTLRQDVYANRFASPARTLYTVYNARFSDVAGDLLRIEGSPDTVGTVLDLWTGEPAATRREQSGLVIQGRIAPHSTGLFLLIHQ